MFQLRLGIPRRGLSAAKTLPLLRQAAALAPERVDLRSQLARALLRTRAHREAVDLLKPLLAQPGADSELLLILGRCALAINEDRLAVEALNAAETSGLRAACGYLAEALYRLNRHGEALSAAERRLRDKPTDFEALQVAAHVLFRSGEIERLWRLCTHLQSRGAWGGWFSAVSVATAARLALHDEFERLCDRPRWFSAEKLCVADDFNERLAAELLALRPAPTAMRIDDLEEVGGPVSRELFTRLHRSIESYAAVRQGGGDDALMAHQPTDALLTGWAILTETAQHHGWHLHQAGWISGVYYIRVPETERDGDTLAGGIEFGPYPFEADEDKLRPYRWRVRPEPGLLIMFPSYFAHRTWPTGVSDPRLCVAFDVRSVSPPASEQEPSWAGES
jgi:tetratricopeptide (TPR) repeat protein